LDTVSTARGSGWVRRRHLLALLRTHPLPRAVLTVSKKRALDLTPRLRRPGQITKTTARSPWTRAAACIFVSFRPLPRARILLRR